MNFLNLEYFVRIADEGSFTRVAEIAHVSQQSLSKHVKKLEDTLGVRLLDRTDGLKLTGAGECLYRYAVQLLRTKADMETELQDMRDSQVGTLRIGSSYTRGCVCFPALLPMFQQENPLVKIRVLENSSQVLEDYLIRGHIDLYMGTDQRQHPKIQIVDLYRERLFLVAPKAIAQEKGLKNDQPVRLEMFADCDFLMLSKANRVRKTIDDELERQGQELKIILELENIETLFELACRGMGLTVYPEMFLQRHQELIHSPECSVRLFPLEGACFSSVLSVGYNKSRRLSPAARDFIALAQAQYK